MDIQRVRPPNRRFQDRVIHGATETHQTLVTDISPSVTNQIGADGHHAAPARYGIRLAAVAAPSSQHASLSFASSAPITVTGSCRRFHRRQVAIVSTLRTAPVVSEPPWTYRAYGRPMLASKQG